MKGKISNAIIQLDEKVSNFVEKILNELSQLSTKSVSLWFNKSSS